MLSCLLDSVYFASLLWLCVFVSVVSVDLLSVSVVSLVRVNLWRAQQALIPLCQLLHVVPVYMVHGWESVVWYACKVHNSGGSSVHYDITIGGVRSGSTACDKSDRNSNLVPD